MLSPKTKNAILGATRQKLGMNIGVIVPQHIESELLDLEKYAKTKAMASPVLMDAISLYKNFGGRIQLFDLTVGVSGASDIAPYIPFIPGNSRFSLGSEMNRPIPCIFVNMYRIGNWTADDKSYSGFMPITDLQTALESGYIGYKMIIENKADDVLSNAAVMENLGKIYVKLFYDALIGVDGNVPLMDFQQDAGKFIIAKFFYTHILGKDPNDQSTNAYARLAAGCGSSIGALVSYSDNLGINYEKLSTFLSSFGMTFFNGRPTTMLDFESKWLKMYGEGLAMAVEYVPYLLHFLFAAYHASRLGGSSRLDRRLPDLQKLGLAKLYNAVITTIQK